MDPSVEPDTGCIDGMEPLAFAISLGTGGAVNLIAHAGDGYVGVASEGWTELQPGWSARNNLEVDRTLFVQVTAPADVASAMLAGVLGEFGLSELPSEPAQVLPTEALTWNVYIPSGLVPMLVAKADADEMTFLAMLIASRSELEDLAGEVLMPALQALTPARSQARLDSKRDTISPSVMRWSVRPPCVSRVRTS